MAFSGQQDRCNFVGVQVDGYVVPGAMGLDEPGSLDAASLYRLLG